MKSFSEYIAEAYNFRLGGSQKKGFREYHYWPKDEKELEKLMDKLCKERGEDGDFNDIDTSNVTNMKWLFAYYTKNFNGDISQWETSNVTNMYGMFKHAMNFNRDISGWDTSNVTDMRYMFDYATSFNQDISQWNVSKVTDMNNMFDECPIKEEYKPKFNI